MNFIMRLFYIFLISCVMALWVNNSSLLAVQPSKDATKLIAHRGVHQVYENVDRSNDLCRAKHIGRIEHDFVENTLPSIQAAFSFGADVVEIDVHRTVDDVFVVFHDWTLDCQTNGTGVTHKQTYDDIASLDAGFGFTDDGRTYPFRGRGSVIPRIEDILSADLDGQLLINFKSNRSRDGELILPLLKDKPIWGVYGGAKPTRAAHSIDPDLLTMDRPSLIKCWVRYMALGWTGYVPEACRDRWVGVPINYANLLWGWPNRLTDRMGRHGTKVVIWGPYDGSGFSSGINTIENLDKVPSPIYAYIWTDKIEVIGPIVKADIPSRSQ